MEHSEYLSKEKIKKKTILYKITGFECESFDV